MRKVTKLIPMELVLPERYNIEVSLNGDNSQLHIHEFYSSDVPQGLVTKTFNIALAIAGTREGIALSNPSKTEIILEVAGPEFAVIGSLLGEMEIIRSYFSSISNPRVKEVL